MIQKLRSLLQKNNLDLFFRELKTLFAQIPYTIQLPQEKYYQSIFYVCMKLIGAQISSEEATNCGRIDALIEAPQAIYIFELKVDTPATQALQQIEDKRYYEKFLSMGKDIYLIGITFSSKKRTIEDWVVKNIY